MTAHGLLRPQEQAARLMWAGDLCLQMCASLCVMGEIVHQLWMRLPLPSRDITFTTRCCESLLFKSRLSSITLTMGTVVCASQDYKLSRVGSGILGASEWPAGFEPGSVLTVLCFEQPRSRSTRAPHLP